MNDQPVRERAPSSTPAERMRRSRELRRRGACSVRVELHVTQLEALIRKGYLAPTSRDDRGDIAFSIVLPSRYAQHRDTSQQTWPSKASNSRGLTRTSSRRTMRPDAYLFAAAKQLF